MTNQVDEELEGLNLFDEENDTNTTQTEEDNKNNTNATQVQHNNKIELERKESQSKVRRNFYIREDLDEQLNDLASKTNLSKSKLVNRALSFLIENVELK
ncbi:MAG: ribbon-helix-helix domain-containing protein [Halanaerobacter sp.]